MNQLTSTSIVGPHITFHGLLQRATKLDSLEIGKIYLFFRVDVPEHDLTTIIKRNRNQNNMVPN